MVPVNAAGVEPGQTAEFPLVTLFATATLIDKLAVFEVDDKTAVTIH